MPNRNKYRDKSFYFLIILATVIYFIAQIAVTTGLLYYVFLNDSKDRLSTYITQVSQDIKYGNGKFNLINLYSDPNYISSYPLYIIAVDGSVVNRRLIINGYLDKSNITRFFVYRSPSTLQITKNENWRVYSQEIKSNNIVEGLIAVSVFEPDLNNLPPVDNELKDSAKIIVSNIKIHNNKIIIAKNIRSKISYRVNYEVIDQFNNILARSSNIVQISRLPDYIDRSYVGDVLNSPKFLQVKDTVTKEPYLVIHYPLKDNDHNDIALIASGLPIGYIYKTIENFILIQCIFGVILIILLNWAINILLRWDFARILKKVNIKYHEMNQITKISFTKKENKILINDISVTVPFATNQYYFCEALFSSPTKRWEADELLKRFGENDLTQWHKVYDAMKIMNKRVEHLLPGKLFILRNKVYQINPLFQHIIS